jgi:ABC-type branched-subunit amino acid transport system ATPase component
VLVAQNATLVGGIADDIVILSSSDVAFRGAAGDMSSDNPRLVQYLGVV